MTRGVYSMISFNDNNNHHLSSYTVCTLFPTKSQIRKSMAWGTGLKGIHLLATTTTTAIYPLYCSRQERISTNTCHMLSISLLISAWRSYLLHSSTFSLIQWLSWWSYQSVSLIDDFLFIESDWLISAASVSNYIFTIGVVVEGEVKS
jgi:hypothetical protein